jgi:hypothetical protein
MAGIIGDALLGGLAGVGAGGFEGARVEQRADIDAQRERLHQQLAGEREERNARLASQFRTEEEKRKGTVVSPGSTLKREGQPDYQAPAAPEKALTEEDADLKRAQAEELRARQRFYDRDRGKTEKEPKPIFPKLVKSEQDGVTSWIDQNTGAVGTINAAVEGKPAEKNWIFPNKPAVSGKPASMTWSVGGEVLNDREYNQRFYGDANKVSGRGGDGAAAPKYPEGTELNGPGGRYVVRGGVPVLKGAEKPAATPKPAGKIDSRSAPQASALTVEPFLTRQRGGFMFQASPRSSGVAKQLNGRTFKSAQEAQDAYDELSKAGA